MSDGRTVHVVSISMEAYLEAKSNIPPRVRFMNPVEWKFDHFWMYAPNGDVVVFTPEKIEKLVATRVEGW